jgi:mercuric ion transport protein
MLRVELIYDADCPNVSHVRRALLEAFSAAGLQPAWTEHDRRSPDSPDYVRQYGSPTILVNGSDAAGTEPTTDASACRLYEDESGKLNGSPPVPRIALALRTARAPERSVSEHRSWWHASASLPGVGAALLPVAGCPACFAASAGILGSLGAGVLLQSAYLFPITAALLGLALFALAYRATARRGYGPLVLGTASACIVVVFKFFYPVDPLVYAGLSGLVAASVWNAWPTPGSRPATGSCRRCVPQQPDRETGNAL